MALAGAPALYRFVSHERGRERAQPLRPAPLYGIRCSRRERSLPGSQNETRKAIFPRLVC